MIFIDFRLIDLCVFFHRTRAVLTDGNNLTCFCADGAVIYRKTIYIDFYIPNKLVDLDSRCSVLFRWIWCFFFVTLTNGYIIMLLKWKCWCQQQPPMPNRGYSYNCYLHILKRAQTYAFIYLSHYQLHWIIVCAANCTPSCDYVVVANFLYTQWKFSLATRAYAAETARLLHCAFFFGTTLFAHASFVSP